jgi:nitroreductase
MQSDAGEKWARRFGVPEDYRFAVGLALGYKDKETPTHPIKKGRIILL